MRASAPPATRSTAKAGKIGPWTNTGANRDNLDYLLENIADPSAVVAPDFRMSLITLKDGRVLAGMVTAKNDRTLTLRTMTDVQTVERAEIVKTEESPLSMMPEGLLAAFSPEQTCNLFSHSQGPPTSITCRKRNRRSAQSSPLSETVKSVTEGRIWPRGSRRSPE